MRKRKSTQPQEGRPEGYEILIGYIKSFDYHNDEAREQMQGHPAVGRCYRVIKDDTGYRLHIGPENNDLQFDGLHLGARLKAKKTYYSFEIEPVTPKNLLDLKLSKDELQQVSEWMDSDNADLWSKLHTEAERLSAEKAFAGIIADALTARPEEDIEIVFKTNDLESSKLLADSLNTISEKDPEAFLAILDSLVYIASTYADKYESKDFPNVSKQIITKGTVGGPINMWQCMKYAQRYMTEGYEKSHNIKDVFKIIHYALYEIQRRRRPNTNKI
jgi:hypothetical protein